MRPKWHYQVEKQKGTEYYTVVEVYTPHLRSEAVRPSGNSKREVIAQLERMLRHCKRYAVLKEEVHI